MNAAFTVAVMEDRSRRARNGNGGGLVRELLAEGEMEAALSERVHRLAEALLRKLGWISRNLLEAVLVENDENPKEIIGVGLERYFPAGCLIINTISDPAGKYPDTLRRLVDRRDALRSTGGFTVPLTPRRFREAWASWEITGGEKVARVVLRTKGQWRGRPREDEVVGDLNLWMWDNAAVLRSPDLSVTLDGDPVDGSALERLRDLSEPGRRLVVDCDRLTPEGFLDDVVEMDPQACDRQYKLISSPHGEREIEIACSSAKL